MYLLLTFENEDSPKLQLQMQITVKLVTSNQVRLIIVDYHYQKLRINSF